MGQDTWWIKIRVSLIVLCILAILQSTNGNPQAGHITPRHDGNTVSALAGEEEALPVGLPDPATLRFGQLFYQDAPGQTSYGGGNYSFFIRYNLTDAGTANEALHILLVLAGPSDPSHPGALAKPWAAIGYGESMLRGEMNVCHSFAATGENVKVHEHFTMKKYLAPYENEGPNQLVTPIQGVFRNGQLSCHFKRRTRANDSLHYSLDVHGATRMLWAFNPRPTKNYRGEWFSYHDTGHRGAMVANLADGMMAPRDTANFDLKALHGFGMASVWMILFPASVFYARYLRSKYGWIVFHISAQVTGIVAICIFLTVILLEVQYWDRPHSILGATLIGFLVVQLSLGIPNVMGLWNEELDRIRPVIRLIHRFLGATLMLASVVQVFLGLDTLFPFVEPRVVVVWVLYFVVIAGWVTAFLATEFYYRRRLVRKDVGMGGVVIPPSSQGKNGGGKYVAAKTMDVPAMQVDMMQERLRPGMRTFTWETLNETILGGEMLVVANSRYVYDISKWIRSHPGGQIILHAVCGTDISNDYFHEAGFDADEFTPKPAVPAQRPDRIHAGAVTRVRSGSFSGSISPSVMQSVIESARRLPSMNEQDWRHITKSRRTHVHTKLALQKLSDLIVGELMPSDDAAFNESATTLAPSLKSETSGTGIPFDRYEFRRYALTEKELINPTAIGNRTPVYRLRFCLLYPYDTRDHESQAFIPGQCIELQMRINNRLVSRYYTPYTGSLTAFEIHVKMYDLGTMTGFLKRQRVGDRQYRIRGPFGGSILPEAWRRVERPLGMGRDEKRLCYFAGGSGIAPFLQVVHEVLLPVYVPLVVTSEYIPTIPDELALNPGDRVMAKHHYYDGWCLGINLTTSTEGVFPLSATAPPCNPSSKLVLIHSIRTPDEIFGRDVLEGVMLSYPDQLAVYYFVDSVTTPIELGIVQQGRLTQKHVEAILTEIGFESGGGVDLAEDADEEGTRCCVVCGPPGYDSFVVDCLMECGVGGRGFGREVKVLPSDRWVGKP
ncbi:hypothetical protein SpCBS45565_g05118 [Spizellomyces sp. 'palustris']|nr:hypothetical protein SpCBS45565_g05118 [Spizellomyces sp. 'palustris']